MPIVFIEAPPRLAQSKKEQLVREISASIENAYQLGGTMVFFREYSRENVAIDGQRLSERSASAKPTSPSSAHAAQK